MPALFGAAIVLGLTALRIADPYPLQVSRDLSFDLYQRLLPRQSGEVPVGVVDIDDAALAGFGQWPWPRDQLALLVERLNELGAAAIAFDMIFAEPDRLSPSGPADSMTAALGNDERFASALRQSPSVLGFALAPGGPAMEGLPKGGFAVSGADPTASVPRLDGVIAPLPMLADAAQGLGALSLNSSDAVSVVRRVPLLWASGGSLFPALSIEGLRLALGAGSLVVFGDGGGNGYVEAVRIGQFTVPTTASGDILLYYAAPDPRLSISASQILGPDYRNVAELIAGNIVLIGTSASGLNDLHTTTLGDNVAGVTIHAQVLGQILTGTFLSRSDWVGGLELLSFVLVGALLVVTVLWLGPVAGLTMVLGVAALVLAGCWLAFARAGILVDPSFLLFGTFVVYAAMIFLRFVLTDADRRQIRRAFSHFVSPALLTEIENNAERLKLGGEVRDLTILFSDMRNYTSLSETLAPTRLVHVLNTLFGAFGLEITSRFGTIDKFIGDAVMAFWNAPVAVDNHASRACEAALAMRARLRTLNATDAFGLAGSGAGEGDIAVGIGIATGEALVGNLGLESRFDYSCVGDTVNIASRVEGACKTVGYDIVVADETRVAAPGLAYLEAGSIPLKGKRSRVAIHLLVGDAELANSRHFAELGASHRQLLDAVAIGTGAGPLIASCVELAGAVDPRLAEFYRLLPARAADFAPELDGQAAGSAAHSALPV